MDLRKVVTLSQDTALIKISPISQVVYEQKHQMQATELAVVKLEMAQETTICSTAIIYSTREHAMKILVVKGRFKAQTILDMCMSGMIDMIGPE